MLKTECSYCKNACATAAAVSISK